MHCRIRKINKEVAVSFISKSHTASIEPKEFNANCITLPRLHHNHGLSVTTDASAKILMIKTIINPEQILSR